MSVLMPSVTALGRHLLADMYGVTADLLRDEQALERLLIKAAEAAHAHVLSSHFRRFGGAAGVTGVVVLSESHISVHTWPEHGFAALDVFMCGDAQPEKALALLEAEMAPHRVVLSTVRRGPGHAEE
jgi:S-adenosylmethionine decarboxylase